jgi:hypothetical protein
MGCGSGRTVAACRSRSVSVIESVPATYSRDQRRDFRSMAHVGLVRGPCRGVGGLLGTACPVSRPGAGGGGAVGGVMVVSAVAGASGWVRPRWLRRLRGLVVLPGCGAPPARPRRAGLRELAAVRSRDHPGRRRAVTRTRNRRPHSSVWWFRHSMAQEPSEVIQACVKNF